VPPKKTKSQVLRYVETEFITGKTTNAFSTFQNSRVSTRHAFFVVAGRLKVRRRAYGGESSQSHTLSPHEISNLSRSDLQIVETALSGTKRTSKGSEIVTIIAGIQIVWAILKLAQRILKPEGTTFSALDIDLIAYTFWGSLISLTWALVCAFQLCNLTCSIVFPSSSYGPREALKN